MKDYYAILGVDREASQEEIKRAFRALARASHPDANPGDPTAEARFREVAEAYEVLSNPQKRAAYDRGDTVDLGDLFAGFAGIDDILRTFFGGSGLGGFGFTVGRPARTQGSDVLVGTAVGLAEAAFGVSRELVFHAPTVCETCRGSGAAEGTSPQRCERCGGSGAVQMTRRTLLGNFTSVGACDRCGGRGETIPTPCPVCRAGRVVNAERRVTVDIPAGVEDGTRLRLRARGGASEAGGPPGDLYVEITVTPDPRYRREGDDVRYVARVGIAEAALGTSAAVPLIEGGEELLDVPAGTQPGSVFRLPGKGMGRLNRRGRGDLLVDVQVEVPERLLPEEEELLRRFAELRAEQPAPPRRRRRLR